MYLKSWFFSALRPSSELPRFSLQQRAMQHLKMPARLMAGFSREVLQPNRSLKRNAGIIRRWWMKD